MSEISIIVCLILVDRTLDVSIWWVRLTASASLVVLEMAELDANVLLLKSMVANLRSVVPMLNVDLTKKESDNASALRTFPMEIPIKVVHHHLEVRLHFLHIQYTRNSVLVEQQNIRKTILKLWK